MMEILYLTKRNILIYRRDKAYVFFSVLSMLILLGLMVLFLGKSNVDYLYETMVSFAGENADLDEMKSHATSLIYLWTLAGAIAANGITVPLSIYSNMINDEKNGRLQAFYTAPVKRWKLTLGYIISSWVIGIAICLITFLVGQIYFAINGLFTFDLRTCLIVVAAIIVSSFAYSVIGYAIAIFVHSSSAWSGFLTVAGTLVGFLGGMYLPYGSMSEIVQTAISGLPVIHGAALLRMAIMEGAMNQYFDGVSEVFVDAFKNQMGIELQVGGNAISPCQNVLLLVCYMLVALLIGIFATNKRKMK